MYVYMYLLCMYILYTLYTFKGHRQAQKRVWDSAKDELQAFGIHPKWVLRTDLGPSGRALFNHWVVSLASLD